MAHIFVYAIIMYVHIFNEYIDLHWHIQYIQISAKHATVWQLMTIYLYVQEDVYISLLHIIYTKKNKCKMVY